MCGERTFPTLVTSRRNKGSTSSWQALEAVSGATEDFHSLAPARDGREAPPPQDTAYRLHCRWLSASYRDGGPRSQRRKCPPCCGCADPNNCVLTCPGPSCPWKRETVYRARVAAGVDHSLYWRSKVVSMDEDDDTDPDDGETSFQLSQGFRLAAGPPAAKSFCLWISRASSNSSKSFGCATFGCPSWTRAGSNPATSFLSKKAEAWVWNS